MAAMSPGVGLRSDLSPEEILDIVRNDERWKIAEAEYGLKSVSLRVNLRDPTKGRISTKWTDPTGPVEFLMRFRGAFNFYKGGEAVVTATEAPDIDVSPERLSRSVESRSFAPN